MDEESERKKLSDMGLTDDVIEIVLEKKRELLRKQTQQIIIQSEPQPEPQPEPQQPEPQQPEPQQQQSLSVIDEIPPPETPLVEIQQQQQIIQKHLPIWKRRLQQRLNLSNHI